MTDTFTEIKTTFFGSLRFNTTDEMVPALVREAKEGNETSKYQLFWHYFKLVYKLSFKYYSMCNTTVLLEDFVCYCYSEAMPKAVEGYKLGQNAQFVTYLWFKLRKACQKLYNRNRVFQDMPTYFEPEFREDYYKVQIHDILDLQQLDELVQRCTKSDKAYQYVSDLLSSEGLTIKEVANKHGTTTSAVSRSFKNFLEGVYNEKSFAQYRA